MYINDEMRHNMTCDVLNCIYNTYTTEELARPDYDEILELVGWHGLRDDEKAEMRAIVDDAIEIAIDLKTNKY